MGSALDQHVVERPSLVDDVIDELTERARRSEGLDLLQFRSRIGAHQYLRLYALVSAYVKPGSQVLDWGVGNGHCSYYLVRAGYRATGFSLDPFGFEGWLPAEYRCVSSDRADPKRLPFDTASFDAVLSVGVLEHVRETGGTERASLAEITRVLRPGAVFICYHLPSRHSVIERLAGRLPSKYHHAYRFTAREIEALVAGAGLELLELRRYGLLPRNALAQAPRPLRDSRALARGWDLLDAGLGHVLSRICQNYCFVARKPNAPPLRPDPDQPRPA